REAYRRREDHRRRDEDHALQTVLHASVEGARVDAVVLAQDRRRQFVEVADAADARRQVDARAYAMKGVARGLGVGEVGADELDVLRYEAGRLAHVVAPAHAIALSEQLSHPRATNEAGSAGHQDHASPVLKFEVKVDLSS